MSISSLNSFSKNHDSVREQKLNELNESLEIKARALDRRAKELKEREAQIERTSVQVADLLEDIRINSASGNDINNQASQERYEQLLDIIFNHTYIPDDEQPEAQNQKSDNIMA